MTSTENVHEPLAGMVAPLKASDMPDVAATVALVQVVAALAGFAISKPPGILSVTLTPVMARGFELVNVTVNLDLPPAPIVDGTNAFATAGPTRILFTADTAIAVPGPAPSGSIVARFRIVTPPTATILNCTVAAAFIATTPGAWPGLLTGAAVVKGIVPPAPSATLTPFNFVLPAT